MFLFNKISAIEKGRDLPFLVYEPFPFLGFTIFILNCRSFTTLARGFRFRMTFLLGSNHVLPDHK